MEQRSRHLLRPRRAGERGPHGPAPRGAEAGPVRPPHGSSARRAAAAGAAGRGPGGQQSLPVPVPRRRAAVTAQPRWSPRCPCSPGPRAGRSSSGEGRRGCRAEQSRAEPSRAEPCGASADGDSAQCRSAPGLSGCASSGMKRARRCSSLNRTHRSSRLLNS